jgi:hypothetical protein
MTSITRTSSGALANAHLASSSAPAAPARAPVANTSPAAQLALLADRPPLQSDAGAGAERPRASLNSIRLSSLKKLADTAPDGVASAAASVCQQVHQGTIKLGGSYPAAALRAASMAAAQGVLALQRDAARRTDPPGPTPA